jgi:hypothetical protein
MHVPTYHQDRHSGPEFDSLCLQKTCEVRCSWTWCRAPLHIENGNCNARCLINIHRLTHWLLLRRAKGQQTNGFKHKESSASTPSERDCSCGSIWPPPREIVEKRKLCKNPCTARWHVVIWDCGEIDQAQDQTCRYLARSKVLLTRTDLTESGNWEQVCLGNCVSSLLQLVLQT